MSKKHFQEAFGKEFSYNAFQAYRKEMLERNKTNKRFGFEFNYETKDHIRTHRLRGAATFADALHYALTEISNLDIDQIEYFNMNIGYFEGFYAGRKNTNWPAMITVTGISICKGSYNNAIKLYSSENIHWRYYRYIVDKLAQIINKSK